MGKKSRNQKFTESFPKTRKPVIIEARNPRQKEYIQEIHKNDITFGMGSAGTGKTFIAAMLAVKYFTDGLVDKIVICRPAVTAGGEKLGYIPGGIEDKMDPFIRPIFDAFQTYWNVNTIKQHLVEGSIELVPLAYMRGRSFENAFIIADEMQNATPENLLMLMTRLGDGSKMVITGDPVQNDVNGHSCFKMADRVLSVIENIGFVYFHNDDVVRHPTVEQILNVWPNNGITVDNEQPELPAFITAA